MSEDVTPKGGCREFELLMMAHFDGEISAANESRLKEHLKGCAACRKAFDEYGRLVTASRDMEPPKVSEEEWDMYWTNVYNRMERSAAWTAVTIGFIAVAGYLTYLLAAWLSAAQAVPCWAKVAIVVLALGVVVLFLSVLREKMSLRKTDKYKGVQR
jgi:predicted anti-sigma-YlaC factor YlaD